jgi:uncharacterized protein (TIGR03083 family)
MTNEADRTNDRVKNAAGSLTDDRVFDGVVTAGTRDEASGAVEQQNASKELVALLTTLDDAGPTALTSCPGWTAHHIAAHMTGNYQEARRHVEAFAQGDPLNRTRGFEEREEPLRELDQPTLLQRIEQEAAALTSAIGGVLDTQPDAELPWTNRTVRVSGFSTHLRSESALHRWDLAGDDDISSVLLSQQDLLEHAVTFIGQPLCQRGLDFGGGKPAFSARVRCAERDDLIIDADELHATLSVGPSTGDAAIETDAAARLLLLWGRKPTPFFRLRTSGGDDSVSHVQFLLLGY